MAVHDMQSDNLGSGKCKVGGYEFLFPDFG